jgi:hypothetical protein
MMMICRIEFFNNEYEFLLTIILIFRTDNKMSSKTSKKADMKEKLIEKDKNKKKSNLI